LEAADVAQLLKLLGHAAGNKGIAVAVNGEVVPRSEWDGHRLHAGDEVEIVGAVQGG
jgi:sulfur carrier protein